MNKRITKKTVACKYKQGRGYVATYYYPKNKTWICTGELSFGMANSILRSCRESWDTKSQDYIKVSV